MIDGPAGADLEGRTDVHGSGQGALPATPRLASRTKLVLLVMSTLWVSTAGLTFCAVGFALGGGFSPMVAIIPASAILWGASHAAVGWAQDRWPDTGALNRLGLSFAAAADFELGWAGIFKFKVDANWLVGALPTLGGLACLVAAMTLSHALAGTRSR